MSDDLGDKKYLVAVSGGVDSVVLLDMMTKKYAKGQLLVAHFDHGIRSNSAEDAQFVSGLASQYGLEFELQTEKLGPLASEELARVRRYLFLREMAKKHQATIVTAHHLDDVVESIMINLKRGTGWRGLAVMNARDISRPLLAMTKEEILEYAKVNHLQWREDYTNQDQKYLRNQVRQQLLKVSNDQKRQLFALWAAQEELGQQIEKEIKSLIFRQGWRSGVGSRYFFINISQPSALECLRFLTRGLLTRPQLQELLLAIKTYATGKQILVGERVQVLFSTRNFIVKLVE